MGIVKHELDTPSHNYNAPVDSAWTLYNHITLALKDSHPMRYLGDHQKVHTFFLNNLGSSTVVNNTTISPIIDDFEEETVFEEAEDSVFGVTFL